jgi:hypothetical protein
MDVAPEHVASETSHYLLVSSGRALEAKKTLLEAPMPPDLVVRSPSPEAQLTARIASAGRHVRTIEEPLLARRRAGESLGDFTKRCADALYALYALDTGMALVIVDELPRTRKATLLLDEQSLLHIAESLDQSALGQE